MERNEQGMEQTRSCAWNKRRRCSRYNPQAQKDERLKVVLDTNILVSASFWNGPSSKIISLVSSDLIMCFTSNSLLEEYHKVILRDFNISEDSFNERQKDLLKIATVVYPTQKLFACEDKDDNKVLEVALCANADFIISGDKHLLKMSEFNGIKIVTARQFIEFFTP
ncbi:MAG: putative toxin-antitoxin system toxin component, PIN family [Candidatus ainarchaeum sp.]|nr:putative toxin-antitoxin system toxin component, PIN family [Candidatus ainarchaeum sp.]